LRSPLVQDLLRRMGDEGDGHVLPLRHEVLLRRWCGQCPATHPMLGGRPSSPHREGGRRDPREMLPGVPLTVQCTLWSVAAEAGLAAAVVAAAVVAAAVVAAASAVIAATAAVVAATAASAAVGASAASPVEPPPERSLPCEPPALPPGRGK